LKSEAYHLFVPKTLEKRLLMFPFYSRLVGTFESQSLCACVQWQNQCLQFVQLLYNRLDSCIIMICEVQGNKNNHTTNQVQTTTLYQSQ